MLHQVFEVQQIFLKFPASYVTLFQNNKVQSLSKITFAKFRPLKWLYSAEIFVLWFTISSHPIRIVCFTNLFILKPLEPATQIVGFTKFSSLSLQSSHMNCFTKFLQVPKTKTFQQRANVLEILVRLQRRRCVWRDFALNDL